MKDAHWINSILKKSEYKQTPLRDAIGAWIAKDKDVFSVQEIMRDLPALDKVSVYRTIELFASLDIIHPVLTQHGEQHYELHGDKHHHHAVCEVCEKTACVPCPISEKIVKGFQSMHHHFVLTGLCNQCAA